MNNGRLDVKIIPLEKINPNISRVKLHVAYPDENRKKFDIPKSTFDKMKDSLLGSPIVMHYFERIDAIGGHEGDVAKINGEYYKTGKTHAYGFIAYDVEPWYEEVQEDDGTINEYLTSIGYVWENRFPEETKHLYTAMHSMEISISDGYMKQNGSYRINDGSFLALCALNNGGVTPTFESSKFVRFSSEELTEELKALKSEFSSFIDDEDFAIPKKYEHINFKPPESVAKQAKIGLDMRSKQSDSNKCCTPVGMARANQLVKRQELSPSIVKRMKAYFDRHEVDKKGKDWDNESKGRQAWHLWGGDAGYTWAKKVVNQMNKADENFALNEIKVSTDGDKKIEGNVGKKNVGEMKKKVLNSSNKTEVIPKIFARYPDNLSGDIIQSDIGYPLMSERDGVFYYNTGFIKSASSRIEQNKDQPYYSKVRSRIVDARKKTGMSEEFSNESEVLALDKDMMRKAMMNMYEKYGMRYMPYGMDEGCVYAMDTEKEMAKVKIPYAMNEEEMAMDYEKMMVEDYEEMEMAIKTAMGILKEKMDENMAMRETEYMEKYSTIETELEKANEKIKDFSSEDQNEILKKIVELQASIEEKDEKIEKLEKENETFSKEIEVVRLAEKNSKVKEVLSQNEFSMFTEEEVNDLITFSADVDVEELKREAQCRAFKKLLSAEAFSMPEKATFSRMGRVDNKQDDSSDKSKGIWDEYEEKYNQ